MRMHSIDCYNLLIWQVPALLQASGSIRPSVEKADPMLATQHRCRQITSGVTMIRNPRGLYEGQICLEAKDCHCIHLANAAMHVNAYHHSNSYCYYD